MKTRLEDLGCRAVVPALDKRFWSRTGFKGGAVPSDKNTDAQPSYTSSWSERHAAFVCGLGTFGLSKGLITEKGTAGRFGSVITDLYLPRDRREYKDIYEYCSGCGACAVNCPANAISTENGKNHAICSAYLDKTME